MALIKRSRLRLAVKQFCLAQVVMRWRTTLKRFWTGCGYLLLPRCEEDELRELVRPEVAVYLSRFDRRQARRVFLFGNHPNLSLANTRQC